MNILKLFSPIMYLIGGLIGALLGWVYLVVYLLGMTMGKVTEFAKNTENEL